MILFEIEMRFILLSWKFALEYILWSRISDDTFCFSTFLFFQWSLLKQRIEILSHAAFDLILLKIYPTILFWNVSSILIEISFRSKQLFELKTENFSEIKIARTNFYSKEKNNHNNVWITNFDYKFYPYNCWTIFNGRI